jgi:hypothetical protein
MTMPWFRMYNESRNDRKLDTLADDEFRVWHKLLCCASEGKDRGTIDADDRELLAIEVARGDEESAGAHARAASETQDYPRRRPRRSSSSTS